MLAVQSTFLLCINDLRDRIQLQTLLCHILIFQEVQRHPDKMPFDAVELLLDVRDGDVGVV